jgi:hypothetical protein
MDSAYEYDYQELGDQEKPKKVKRLKTFAQEAEPSVFDFDEEEVRVVLYDELTYFPPVSDLYELEIASLDEVVPFGKPTIEYLQTLKRGTASGTQFPSKNPNVAASQNPEYNSRPVSNKRDARRMSKSIVSGILQNAFRMQTSPDRIAEIPVDRMSSIPV